MCWLQDRLLQVIGWLLADTSSLFEVTQMCVTITQDCLEVSLKDKCFSVTIIMLVTVLSSGIARNFVFDVTNCS